ncbi:metal-dependent transcriptional regulator [Dermabacter sp. p3-SID358]|uniref:metal-dependent transcriptional regulator n=1 Tax=Dermabacter sp. p3-SID358 TaxID=2916114 RepID=UPI0021A53860|nr:metal-dependent transcriptional regulator [Dermabacter sp. p3-SID358]MCT1867588.1 metal-dependent transcriptional regulator [Dermabacter sp. p3-SID358]
MSVEKLSGSVQDYLKAVWVLGEWSSDPVTTSRIAERVGVRAATASETIKKLAAQGLVEHLPYGAITLSEEGRTLALAMVRRHRLIETFLVENLGYSWDEVHAEAEVLEHAVSDLMVERIDAALAHPTRDPHGDPIPGPDGKLEAVPARQLTYIEAGVSARVERVSDADPALLQFLAGKGLTFGAIVRALEAEPFSETLDLEVDGVSGIASLGKTATDAVWVTVFD